MTHSISEVEKMLQETKQLREAVTGPPLLEARVMVRLAANLESLAAELLELKLRDRWIPYSHEDGDGHLCGNVWLVRCYWIGDPRRALPADASADDDNAAFMDVATYSHHGGWCVGSDGSQDVAVTHYRALPSPPIATQVAGQGPSNAVTT